MGFWSKVKDLFGGDAPKSAGALLSSIFPSGMPPRRGTPELLMAYKRLPFFHSVTQRIATDVASIPFQLFRRKRGNPEKGIRRLTGDFRRKAISEALAMDEVEEVPSHPFLDLMNNMNPAISGHGSRAIIQIHLDLIGDGFLIKERNGLGLPMELWPIPPHWISDTPSKTSPFFWASYSGWQRNFPESEVVWLRLADPFNPYGRGTGTGEALGDELDIDESATKMLKAWFFNSAMPPAIINLPDMGKPEMERLKERLQVEHRGIDRANRLLITNAEKLEVERLSPTFKEQEFPALRAASRDIVMQVFNIPPEVMGLVENSNRATIEASYFLYTTGVICPRMNFLVSALQPLLTEWGDDSLILSYESPVPEDKEFKKQVILALPQNFTIDEIRALAGAEPLPDGAGDELFTVQAPAPTASPVEPAKALDRQLDFAPALPELSELSQTTAPKLNGKH